MVFEKPSPADCGSDGSTCKSDECFLLTEIKLALDMLNESVASGDDDVLRRSVENGLRAHAAVSRVLPRVPLDDAAVQRVQDALNSLSEKLRGLAAL